MPNTFDDASKATQQMFEDDADLTIDDAITANEEDTPATTPETTTEQAKETSGNETPSDSGASSQVAEPTNTDAVVADAAQTAEAAANLAAQKDRELAQTKQALEAAQQQNAQLQQTIDGMSAQRKEEIIEEALDPPTLDIGALAFADEETVREAQAKYAEDMLAYNRKQIMKELEPVINHAKKGMYESEKKEAIAALSHIPELEGIETMLPQIEAIIKNNPGLSSENMSMEEKLITGYMIARGANSMNTTPQEQKELTTEELMELYKNNPEFQEMVEKQRLAQVESSQQVPPLSASSGAVNAALDIKEKPQTLEEASKRTREMFGDM